jgi:MHS family proline/betaine transporter-like MFS transporter
MIWGHSGDRIGRKGRLAVGITVPFDGDDRAPRRVFPIGLLAPVLLVQLRFTQSISAGGEITGAASFICEHSPDNRRVSSPAGSKPPLPAQGRRRPHGVGPAIYLSPDMAACGSGIPFLMTAPLGLIACTELAQRPTRCGLRAFRRQDRRSCSAGCADHPDRSRSRSRTGSDVHEFIPTGMPVGRRREWTRQRPQNDGTD